MIDTDESNRLLPWRGYDIICRLNRTHLVKNLSNSGPEIRSRPSEPIYLPPYLVSLHGRYILNSGIGTELVNAAWWHYIIVWHKSVTCWREFHVLSINSKTDNVISKRAWIRIIAYLSYIIPPELIVFCPYDFGVLVNATNTTSDIQAHITWQALSSNPFCVQCLLWCSKLRVFVIYYTTFELYSKNVLNSKQHVKFAWFFPCFKYFPRALVFRNSQDEIGFRIFLIPFTRWQSNYTDPDRSSTDMQAGYMLQDLFIICTSTDNVYSFVNIDTGCDCWYLVWLAYYLNLHWFSSLSTVWRLLCYSTWHHWRLLHLFYNKIRHERGSPQIDKSTKIFVG